jgi:tetrapyrrole methylase family protein/MazG family protein
MKTESKDWFRELVEVMRRLRGEDGCPWDRKQTHASLRTYLLEETYEVLDALDREDYDALCEELGDLLLQVVFHAQIACEDGRFCIDDVCRNVVLKLIHRHPHVFGDAHAETPEEVMEHWERLKAKEANHKGSVVKGIPDSMPALLQAYRLQEKASRVGFDWSEIDPVWEKVREELRELEEACRYGDQRSIAHELGDLLFAITNLARFLKVDPETALRECNKRFKRRFEHVEERAREEGLVMEETPLDKLDLFWEEAKREEGGS